MYDRECWAATSTGVWHRTDEAGPWERLCSDWYFDICFRDQHDGLAVARDRLFRTRDGGVTWTRVRLDGAPELLSQIRFVDERHGAIAGGQYGGTHGGWVFTTDDGGATWRERRLTDGKLKAVSFVDEREGWAVGDMDILHTVDGGRTWTVQLHRDNGALALTDVSAFDGRRCWAASQMDGTIWTTDDGGETWRESWSDAKTGISAVGFVTAEIGYAVGFRSLLVEAEQEALFASPSPSTPQRSYIGLVLSTEDGGETWREELIDEADVLYDLALPGGDQLVVLGEGVVLTRSLRELLGSLL
jgi:photosystem II stability/assembly factor-like uncharacterized protein